MESYKMFGCFTRKFNAVDVQPPDDIKDVFRRYADAIGGYMTVDGLRRFLREFQKEDPETTTSAVAGGMIEQIHHRRRLIDKITRHAFLSLDDFFHFLCCPDLNPVLNSQVHHDMCAPLSHYYIFTGHNSYLTGNQLNSDCSDVPIIHALQRGVRVIELDLWPNSKKDDVIVLHGRTLTTPVQLIKCLRSIKEYAFSASPYPVIITLEDHLNAELQNKVAKMIIQTFGNMLFFPENGTLQEFPSPESLKYRVMVSTKPPKEYLESNSFKEGGPEKGKANEDLWGKEVLDVKEEIETDSKSDVNPLDQHSDGDETEDEDPRLSPGLQKGVSEYRRIITIHAGKHKGGMKNWLKVEPNKVRRLSLSEQEVAKATTSHASALIRFTQHNLLRIYPKGTRVDSSNYNPFIGWMYGGQLVALNMQGYGRSLWLMHGFFKANGGCGYLKKPDFLLKTTHFGKVFDPEAKLPVKKTLKVRVYLGDGWHLDFKKTHFDTYSPPDFYTRVGIAGAEADSIMKKTKTIEDNWSPVWDEEFRFPLTVPELALLRVEVHEYDMSDMDDFGGQTCIPISELKPGIRAVPLFDEKGEKYKSVKLLMKFEFC